MMNFLQTISIKQLVQKKNSHTVELDEVEARKATATCKYNHRLKFSFLHWAKKKHNEKFRGFLLKWIRAFIKCVTHGKFKQYGTVIFILTERALFCIYKIYLNRGFFDGISDELNKNDLEKNEH